MREDWGAAPPSGPQTPLPHPISHIRYILNTEVPRCFNDQECITILQEMQRTHMRSGLEDIRYKYAYNRNKCNSCIKKIIKTIFSHILQRYIC